MKEWNYSCAFMWAEILQQISMCRVREKHEISQWVIKGKITPLRDRTKKGEVQVGKKSTFKVPTEESWRVISKGS